MFPNFGQKRPKRQPKLGVIRLDLDQGWPIWPELARIAGRPELTVRDARIQLLGDSRVLVALIGLSKAVESRQPTSRCEGARTASIENVGKKLLHSACAPLSSRAAGTVLNVRPTALASATHPHAQKGWRHSEARATCARCAAPRAAGTRVRARARGRARATRARAPPACPRARAARRPPTCAHARERTTRPRARPVRTRLAFAIAASWARAGRARARANRCINNERSTWIIQS